MQKDLNNLLTDVVDFLKLYDKRPADVRWVGSEEAWMFWEDFARAANREYDSLTQVVPDLMIVGDDWWIDLEDSGEESFLAFHTHPGDRDLDTHVPHLNVFGRASLTRVNKERIAEYRKLNPPGLKKAKLELPGLNETLVDLGE